MKTVLICAANQVGKQAKINEEIKAEVARIKLGRALFELDESIRTLINTIKQSGEPHEKSELLTSDNI